MTISSQMGSFWQMILISLFIYERVIGERNQACDLLIAVDDYGIEKLGGTEESVREKVDLYLSSLEKIYYSTILSNPPNDRIYFVVKEIRYLKGWLPDCNNKDVLLDQFSKIGTSEFCLAHLLTFRDTGCVIGLANIGGLCKKFGNTGWTKVNISDEVTVNTMAHEFGHNFGSDHDGGERLEYSGCGIEGKKGIMAGKMVSNFSTCSLSAMHARLQSILNDEQKEPSCLKTSGFTDIAYSVKDYNGFSVSCPPIVDDECPEDQPDTPDIPEPPPDPVCGDFEVLSPLEECDCGPIYETCTDPCCYPGTISEEDKQANSSATPCTRHKQPRCEEPLKSPLSFGLIYPFIFFFILLALLAIILWIDWRCGKRLCYKHITERYERQKDELHIETQEQKDRRIQREQEKERLKNSNIP